MRHTASRCMLRLFREMQISDQLCTPATLHPWMKAGWGRAAVDLPVMGCKLVVIDDGVASLRFKHPHGKKLRKQNHVISPWCRNNILRDPLTSLHLANTVVRDSFRSEWQKPRTNLNVCWIHQEYLKNMSTFQLFYILRCLGFFQTDSSYATMLLVSNVTYVVFVAMIQHPTSKHRAPSPELIPDAAPRTVFGTFASGHRAKERMIWGFPKSWVSPTTMGFPTKTDYFGVFWGYHHLRKHPYGWTPWEVSRTQIFHCCWFFVVYFLVYWWHEGFRPPIDMSILVANTWHLRKPWCRKLFPRDLFFSENRFGPRGQDEK